MHKRDTLYAQLQEEIAAFVFDETVVEAFPDMIKRSVPGYASILSMLPVIAGRFVQEGSNCYDLGCSLGASTLAIRRGVNRTGVTIHAVDNSEPMVASCRKIVGADKNETVVKMYCEDLRTFPVSNASLIVLNFTLQFIPLAERMHVVDRCYQGLLPGGALVLSEKIAFPEKRNQEAYTSLHHDYKRANGYSDLEIMQKRDALEEVLIPETISDHTTRLQRAGFEDVSTWFQALNFVSLLAVK